MKKFIPILLFIVMIANTSFVYAETEPIIEGEAAILMEADTGKILYQKNIHAKHFPASITKILTSLLVIENANMNDTMTLSENAYNIEKNSSRIGLVPGEQITIENAIYAVLLESANEVANGVAEHVSGSIEEFAKLMNKRAKEIGATDSNFMNPHGLPNENHYTSAHDMAIITREALKNDAFYKIMSTTKYTLPKTNMNEERYFVNHHKMMLNTAYYYNGCIGGKTGWTTAAKNTLVTCANKNGMTLIAVVLKDDSAEKVYNDTKKLLDYGFENYTLSNLFKKDSFFGFLPVFEKGEEEDNKTYIDNAQIYAKEDLSLVFDSVVDTKKITSKLNIPKELIIPIDKTMSIGSINYYYEGAEIGKVELFSDKSFEITKEETSENENKISSILNKKTLLFVGIGIVAVVFIVFLAGIIIKSKKSRYSSYSFNKSNNKIKLPKK